MSKWSEAVDSWLVSAGYFPAPSPTSKGAEESGRGTVSLLNGPPPVVLPLQARIEAITDEADLEEVFNTERHLLYVACARARDHLPVSRVEPGFEVLADFQ